MFQTQLPTANQLNAIYNRMRGRKSSGILSKEERERRDVLIHMYDILAEYVAAKNNLADDVTIQFVNKQGKEIEVVPPSKRSKVLNYTEAYSLEQRAAFIEATKNKPKEKKDEVFDFTDSASETGAVVNNPLVGAGASVISDNTTVPLAHLLSETGAVGDDSFSTTASTVSTPSFSSMKSTDSISDLALKKKVIRIRVEKDDTYTTAEGLWRDIRHDWFDRFFLESNQHTLGMINHWYGFDLQRVMGSVIKAVYRRTKLGDFLRTADKELLAKAKPYKERWDSLSEDTEDRKDLRDKYRPGLVANVERIWRFINDRFEIVIER